MRARVRSYFTAAQTRRRITEMVSLAEGVDAVSCPTTLEADVRELRLIAAELPPYNRRSRHQFAGHWIAMTEERFPRLALVRRPRPEGSAQLGPFASRRSAELIRAALHDAVPLRPCTIRIPLHPVAGAACALAEIGRCGAPCDGSEPADAYARHVAEIRTAFTTDSREVAARLVKKMSHTAAAGRYEHAAEQRERWAALVRALAAGQRRSAVRELPELLAARRRAGGWDLVLVQHGRLTASAHAAPGTDPWPHVDALRATAETTLPGAPDRSADVSPTDPQRRTSAEETDCVLRWLEALGTRLVHLTGVWASAAAGAEGLLAQIPVV